MAQGRAVIRKARKDKKQRTKNVQVIGAILIAVVLVGGLIWNASQVPSASEIERVDRVGTQLGEIAPDFTVATLDGGQFSLSDAQGKPTIIFFMAYWCGTCIPEAQALAQLKQEYGIEVNIIAIDVDPSSSVDLLSQFKSGSGGGEYVWAFDIDQKVTYSYLVRALDTTLVLDADGYVIYRDEYPTSYETLKSVLESLES